jgi:hypothetical protein
MLVEDAGLAPKPGDKSELRNHVTKLIRGLGPESIQRPNFGHGVEHRWLVKGENALWTGLAVDDKPVCLTLHRQAVLPQNPAGPNNPGGQPRGPGPGGSGGGETERQPGVYELERKVRRTPYEERLLDRRKALRQKPNPSRARPPIRSRPTRPTPNRPSPARPSTSPSVPRPVAPSPGSRPSGGGISPGGSGARGLTR